MARPRKNNAEYFSHDAGMRDDPKIKALRKKFQSDGYSVWCMMLELLTSNESFIYKWNELNIELVAGDFDIDSSRIKEIVNYMLLLELLTIEGGNIFSSRHIKRFSGLMEKRNRDNQRYDQCRPEDKAPPKVVSTDGNIQRKEVSADGNMIDIVISTDGNSQSKVKEITNSIIARFDEFWELYDKKDGKKLCLKKWSKLSLTDIEKIFIHVPIYVKLTPDSKYRKNPLKYLNGEHWNDEINQENGFDPDSQKVHTSTETSEFDFDSLTTQHLASMQKPTFNQ